MASDAIDNIESIAAEIAKLQTKLDKAVSAKRATVIEEVKKQISLFNFSAIELGLTDKRVTKPARVPVAPKYQDPNNHKNTWSGRGRTPQWVTASGLPLDKLVIKK